MPSPITYYLMAARPRTLTAGMSPVILGIAAAHGVHINWGISIITLCSCLLLQIGTNMANDYYDGIHDIDSPDRLGPPRMTQQGLLDPKQMRNGFIACFIAAALLGIPLIIKGGLPIVVIGVLSILFAFLYTGGPFPLSYWGMGELLAFIFFGLVACGGTYYLNTETIGLKILLVGSGPGFLAALLMSVNNLRDIETDRTAGKKTVAVFLGPTAARRFSFSLLMLTPWVPIILFTVYDAHPLILLACFTPLLFYRRWLALLTQPIDKSFNHILADTGKLMLIYTLVMALGMVI